MTRTRPILTLLLVAFTMSVPDASPQQGRAPASRRQAWLDRFARGYFPGRSGQIFVVPREGTIVTERDPLYEFMHGSPWDYDSRIPILFHGAPFVRQGRWASPATHQDIAPTLGAIIGAPSSSTYTGRVLANVAAPGSRRPRVAVVMVLDGMRTDYFDRYARAMPTLTRMRREGAWFSQARSNVLPTVTGVGHATIGTGTDPRIHGITVNNLYNRVTGKPQQAFDKLDPRELMALTLADIWNLETDGRALIIGHGGAIRATAGLVGRGACLVNGRAVMAASYSTTDAGWETNPECYRMPESLKAFNGKRYWGEVGGTWMGHDIASPTKFRASAVFQRFEADALLAVTERESIGADETTDLVMVNMKGPDYTGHAYGPDSREIEATLTELDRQMTRLLEVLDRKAGPNQSVIVVTADHGMPPPPRDGKRVYPEEVVAAIHQRLDPDAKALVKYYEDAANNELYIDTARLGTLGLTLKDVARMIETLPHYAAVFTEDDVQAAQSRLPR
jgi:hypothetical protein